MEYPLDNLIPEIVSYSNLYESYNYVVSHLESKQQRGKYAPDTIPFRCKNKILALPMNINAISKSNKRQMLLAQQ